MKKFLLPFSFLILALPAISQNLARIGGLISDLANGNPIPYQMVTITNDSAGGWIYNKTIVTNINGYYIDTVPVPLNSQGILYVRTRDCQNILHQTVLNYSPANLNFTVNFVLCYYPSPCEADFVSVPSFNTVYDFYDQSAGNILSWHWNFGDPASGSSNTANSQNATHIFSQTGTYIVCHTVQGIDSACFDTKCDTVVVGSLTPVYLSISGMVTNVNTGIPMANHPVTWSIEDTLYGPRTTYSNSNGFYADSVLLPPGVNSGTYYVWSQDCMYIMELWASFSPIHLHLTQDFQINCPLNQPCQAKMKVSPAGNLTVQFENKSTGGVSHTFWNFGDGTTSILENPVHTFSTSQDYLILFSISNEVTGCTSNTVKTISFADSTLFNASFSYSNTQTPKTIQFDDQSSGANGNWYWKFGDGDTSTMENPLHTYRHPGLYMVELTIGRLDTASWHSCSKAVLVMDSVYPCQSNFTYTIGFETGPKTVQFTDLSTGTPTEWQWNFGDGDTSTQRFPIHYYAAAGTYHACLTINGSYCSSTYCQDIVVDDSLVYHNVYGQIFAGNFPVSAGQAMIISLDTTGSYNPYVAVCPIDTNGVYYFTLVPEGNYYILATPSDSNGYIPTYYGNNIRWEQSALIPLGPTNNPYPIHLVPASQMTSGLGSISGKIFIRGLKNSLLNKINMMLLNDQGSPIGFTPVSNTGGFGFPTLAYGTYYLHAELPGITSDYVMVIIAPGRPHADVVMTFNGNRIIGLRDELTLVNQWLVYPNPVVDKLTVSIDMKQATNAEFGICNMTGQKVINSRLVLNQGANNIVVSTASLSPGIYSLQIYSPEGLILTTKLVKTR